MRNTQGARLAMVTGLAAALATLSACGNSHTAQPVAATVTTHVSRADRGWIDAAHQANMAEEQAGQLAQLIGATPAIQSAGAMLARDHQALDNKLIPLAQKLKVTLPTSMTVQQITTGDRLSKEAGRQFDSDFTGSMMAAHLSMIAATRQEIARGSSPQVVNLARQALPVLIKHLTMMKAAAAAG